MITLDGYQVAGGLLICTAVVMVAVGVAHQTGIATAEATTHEPCEGCGRDVCAHDPDQLVLCPGTVMLGCFHQRLLCTACMADCGSCRDDLAITRYVWGDR